MKIAVIGGGIGGLAVAYNLIKNWPAGGKPVPEVTVYEATDRFGGNGDTVHFSLGTSRDMTPIAPNFIRWADLGVNDFNATAYVNIVAVMKEIGYTDYLPLEDTTTYYTLDGSTAFTQGQALTSPMTAMPIALAQASDAFMLQAAKDALNPHYGGYSVRQYIEQVFVNNPLYDPRIGPMVIYPRINGMYFTDEVAPSDLPLTAVMHYYSIQEGAGGKPAKRMYFVGGANNWINALTAYMRTKLNINFISNFKASLEFSNGAWQLMNATPGPQVSGVAINPDIVVVATHADDAARMLLSGAASDVLHCLAQIKYLNGISVAHTFAGVMPPDCNAWTTYNILIHQAATALKPYTISYVCNRHQNDAANPAYNVFGLPQYFITVNPPVPIPAQYVLTDTATGQPAVANLRHNVYDFQCQAAQAVIHFLQGYNHLYFAGGWTIGAGLHEECWIQGQRIARQIATGISTNDHLYDASRGAAHYAPHYMRRLQHES